MRKAFVNTLMEIVEKDDRVHLLVGDLGFGLMEPFIEKFPDRYINAGVAEQNMMGVATGMALSGKIVFVYSIANFPTLRCLEQVRNDICYHNVNVNIVMGGGGLAYGALGTTHHATEDIAAMRALPNMNIICPSDTTMTASAARMSCDMKTPNYVRLDREVLPVIYKADTNFSEGLSVLHAGTNVNIIATGNMVHIALEIADKLEEQSVDAGVIDLYRIKPINRELLVENLKRSQRVVTLEEHLLDGGLGSAVLEVLVDSGMAIPVRRFGIPDQYFYAYGGRRNIQKICGIDPDYVSKSIIEWMR